MDPVVKQLTCPLCSKVTPVRVIPTAPSHVYHCPGCKKITKATG